MTSQHSSSLHEGPRHKQAPRTKLTPICRLIKVQQNLTHGSPLRPTPSRRLCALSRAMSVILTCTCTWYVKHAHVCRDMQVSSQYEEYNTTQRVSIIYPCISTLPSEHEPAKTAKPLLTATTYPSLHRPVPTSAAVTYQQQTARLLRGLHSYNRAGFINPGLPSIYPSFQLYKSSSTVCWLVASVTHPHVGSHPGRRVCLKRPQCSSYSRSNGDQAIDLPPAGLPRLLSMQGYPGFEDH
jgi:hypothetical protein